MWVVLGSGMCNTCSWCWGLHTVTSFHQALKEFFYFSQSYQGLTYRNTVILLGWGRGNEDVFDLNSTPSFDVCALYNKKKLFVEFGHEPFVLINKNKFHLFSSTMAQVLTCI